MRLFAFLEALNPSYFEEREPARVIRVTVLFCIIKWASHPRNLGGGAEAVRASQAIMAKLALADLVC
jgi:hypothetical protein